MRKIFIGCLILLSATGSAIAQNGDPYISMLMNPSVVQIGSNGTLEVNTGNAGLDPIVANSIRITISVGLNTEILGLDAGTDPRWTVLTLTSGVGNTIRLTNTGGGFVDFDFGDVFVTVKGSVIGGPSTITGNITYIPGSNPLLGGANNVSQGNSLTGNDNSTTSLTVSNPVPITLSDFAIGANKCEAVLNWKTAFEQNFSRFEVEYSTDGRSFEKVGTVAGTNNLAGSDYQFVYNQGTTKSFYRLKMIDIDGKFLYSKTMSLSTNCLGKQTITIHPNPVVENQKLSVIVNGYDNLLKGELFTVSGQLLATYTLKEGTNTIELNNRPMGTYSLRVSAGNQVAKSFKVVVVK